MDHRRPGLVILGSGLAGYSLAREFRKLDRQTPVTVITADGGEVYSKPMLSAAFSQGKTVATLAPKSAETLAAELAITVLTRRRVTAIDRAAGTVSMGKEAIRYTKLVLAVGADPRPYRVEGSDRVTVHSVNDLDDYAVWRDRLEGGPKRVLLIGAGLIGCEFADDLTAGGHRVSLVDPFAWPLGRLLPEELGRDLAAALGDRGIAIHLGRSVASLAPGEARLDDGSRIGFDLALSAIGLVPRIDLAKACGLTVDRGIVVDRLLASSDPDIYALGDCAQTAAGPLPFVLPLMAEAKALAATLAGTPTPLALPALPVVVKTPSLPVAVNPPPPGAAGAWTISGDGRDRVALFHAPDGRALGFALTGTAVTQRQALAKEMPDLL